MVAGWGDNAECWLIDRFAVRQLADGRTDVKPHKVLEHWYALLGRALAAATLGLAYPLEGDESLELPVACTAIDIGGLPGVDERARDFARALLYRHRVPDWSVMLVKGANRLDAPPLGKPTHEVDDRGKRRRDAVSINVIGVHQIKEALELRLQASEPGPGFVHISADFDERHLAELRGEERQGGVWVRTGRNETWDLLVYNDAARLRLRPDAGDRNWSNPPVWAKPRRRDVANAVRAADPAPRRKAAPVKILNRGV
jgi:phage terminase large subunit GpA-like protein